MEALFLLFVFLIVLSVITVLGHAIWLMCEYVVQSFSSHQPTPSISPTSVITWRCQTCASHVQVAWDFCGNCSTARNSKIRSTRDLAAMERQLEVFRRDNKIDVAIFQQLCEIIAAERTRLTNPQPVSAATTPSQANQEAPPDKPQIVRQAVSLSCSEPNHDGLTARQTTEPDYHGRTARRTTEPTPPSRSVRPPRRSFAEVLNAFMEESNIRWGEIIGGLLIIGCSTALVVSLWSQISQIPVLKFLIFTTVTAALFGIGMYTDHRWKLPTTSRGILTIGTLLVPLNFLAIAAVSSGESSGSLVLASELLAPAIFLCLVYFAGRVITPGCSHLLAAGVLGSSVGQLLVRHFATPDTGPLLLVSLGAFPVLCYVIAVGLALRFVLRDGKVDRTEVSTVFTILGTMSFAALLPFGLLLYKTGPFWMSIMYLAPVVTLWGLPLLATGTVLWRRIQDKELVASRTTGTALGLLGLMIALTGMILAWPNPASIIPAAIINFAILTSLAIVLEIPAAHFFAAGCFGMAYLVLFHVLAGHIRWENLRVTSLVNTCLDITSGQALIGAFGIFVVVSDWLQRSSRRNESYSYLTAACLVAVVSLGMIVVFGPVLGNELQSISLAFLIYSIGALWIGWQRRVAAFTWIGSSLTLFSMASLFAWNMHYSFPWQTGFLAFASLSAVAAIVISKRVDLKSISQPLNYASLICLILAVLSLFQTNPWQVTSMQAERVFWMAAICLVALWLNRRQLLFTAFQIALTAGAILTVKATLQQYEWYTYLPHAFMHPSALQIQGTVLALLSLMWIGVRLIVKKRAVLGPQASSPASFQPEPELVTSRLGPQASSPASFQPEPELVTSRLGPQASSPASFQHAPELVTSRRGRLRSQHSAGDFWKLLDTPYSIDRVIPWVLLGGFVLLAIYGAASGVAQEFAPRGSQTLNWNIAGFPHSEAFALGSWIVMGLLTIIMLANAWERKQRFYLVGAMTAVCAMIPLLAGRFESQLASATAWRFLAAIFFALGSALIWFRKQLRSQLRSFGAPQLNADPEFTVTLGVLLMSLTVVPLLLLTIYPALQAVFLSSVQAPISGVFTLLSNDVSYALPLMFVALVLIGYAIRERAPLFSFSAGLFFNATVTLAYLFSVVSSNAALDSVALVRLTQLNVITFGVYGLFWLVLRNNWFEHLKARATQAETLLKLQMWLALGLMLVLMGTSVLGLMFVGLRAARFPIGDLPGWIALATSFVGFTLVERSRNDRFPLIGLVSFLISVLALIVVKFQMDNFYQLRAFTVGLTACAGLIFAASFLKEDSRLQTILKLDSRWSSQAIRAVTVLGGIACFWALWLFPIFNGHGEASWNIVIIAVLCVLATALQIHTLKRRYLYAAGVSFTLAVSMWWVQSFQLTDLPITHFLEVNIFAACIASILWLYLELRARRIQQDDLTSLLSYHNVVAIVSVVLLVPLARFYLSTSSTQPGLIWWAWAATTALMISTFWDSHAKYATAGLYALGLQAFVIALPQIDLTPEQMAWSVLMFLAAYAIGTALLWKNRSALIQTATRLGIVPRIESNTTQITWLSSVSIFLVVFVTVLGYITNVYSFNRDFRATAAIAVAAQVITLGLLAEGAAQTGWRRGAIAAFLIGAVLFGWAWLTPDVNATWLNRSVILLVETALLTVVYAFCIGKIREQNEAWAKSISSALPALLIAGFLALTFSLSTELSDQLSFGSVVISPAALIAIAAVLITAAVVPVWFAISPARDPLGLSEQSRMKYVYVAELMLALLFLHIRLTMPWLFTGFFERYWPFIAMAIAFGGVLVSEALRRRNLLVLAQPIERTGVFLPLLPVLGFWVATSEVDYSSLLFVVGGLYGLLSSLRRSFLFGMLAAIAGNAGLWYALHGTQDYQFLQHPQLWLVPAALSVLLAAYLNEDKFSEDQMAAIRYLSLLTIYASSTADIFINGVANSPWLPLILGAFSLAGVFSGIMFKIRGLLLLGSVFLLLSITTMIWYASVNFGWTWLWYVAGIATGATIIFMFAVFEKKRNEVMRMVEGLKEWEV